MRRRTSRDTHAVSGDMNRRAFVVSAAALALAPRALARSLGGTPVALVTADLESHVVVVHLTDGDVLKRIRTLRGPRSIERVGEAAVVAHTAHAAVTLLDAVGLRVRSVLREFDQPRYTATLPDLRHAAVSDSGAGAVAVLDVVRGRVVGRTQVGGPARHISVDPRGRRLWVSLGTKAAWIAAVDIRDPRRPRLLGRVRPPFLAHDVGFAPGGGRIWVTSGATKLLALYDPRTARVVATLDAGSPPQHVTFAGARAFVTSGDDGTLRTHDLRGRELGTAAVPVGSYNVQEGLGVVVSPSLERGTLAIADRRGQVLRRVRVARSSHDACCVMAR
jgi:DNA-binding beta-propeller fold protein YncE